MKMIENEMNVTVHLEIIKATQTRQNEPIFLSELPGDSRDYVRQEMKKLVDDGKLERLFNGVYYLSYTTILGTKGEDVDRQICG